MNHVSFVGLNRRKQGERMKRLPKGASRTDVTKNKMLEVAVDAFGIAGYEGVSTRELADRAGVNLGAIRYHFGDKKGLYQSAVQYVADGLRERMSPTLQEVDRRVTRAGISREELMDLLCQLLSGFASQLLRPGISDSWARLLIREQMDPTESFAILYSVMRLVTEGTALIVGKILDAPKDSEDVRIRTMALLGQAIVFRSHRAAALRFVGWKNLGPREIFKVQAVVSNQCRAILRE
jgi:TetR/AcrR family transcriptional regulator, regulator of cefoperazone and chloramphenicol sensitivity